MADDAGLASKDVDKVDSTSAKLTSNDDGEIDNRKDQTRTSAESGKNEEGEHIQEQASETGNSKDEIKTDSAGVKNATIAPSGTIINEGLQNKDRIPGKDNAGVEEEKVSYVKKASESDGRHPSEETKTTAPDQPSKPTEESRVNLDTAAEATETKQETEKVERLELTQSTINSANKDSSKDNQEKDDVDDDEDDEELGVVTTAASRFRKRAAARLRRAVIGGSTSNSVRRTVEGSGDVKDGLRDGEDGTGSSNEVTNQGKSLVEMARELRANPNYEAERRAAEEARFVAQVKAQQLALASAKERATGTRFTERLQTGWKPTRRMQALSAEERRQIRKDNHILVDGADVPPPVDSFWAMRIPRVLVKALINKGIKTPSPIQMQGLPVAFSGRDMIGIAFTGSGKTITFTLPLVIMALGMEMREPVVGSEGPFGIIMGPSRELQAQTYEVIQGFIKALSDDGFPELRAILAIGGQDKREQLGDYEKRGAHIVVGTPGRIIDFLQRGQLYFDACRYVCLDESDRMISEFDEELQTVLGYCKLQRQMLLFSATMPTRLVEFAQTSLVDPITVNASRAGAASLNVIQEIEFMRDEARIPHLLNTLGKTPPPVVIFTQNKKDVDDIYEYLLLKSVEAVAIHGDKSQEERSLGLKQFKTHVKDVLVATDVAAKGLDIDNIRHVINFDMPKEIENYVHRIGRTGRGGNTGVATTYLNSATNTSVLLDLKHLLREANQPIPPVLLKIEDPSEYIHAEDGDATGDTSCAFCGGLGHRITSCPALAEKRRREQAATVDVVNGAAFGGDY
mmetsp:Transcript_9432/g.18706  ORF Transcript_9432/g.18706 Transcript_9432/m.18706 type:complete len:799 (-) Transcript_9432:63-2459(-)|eukprot:CAMPEP_0171514578 /NCGR_PEP_ID=MMETSP0959-20130129/2930_1 /TAXON_ID=87120 /ORGANISM="Aurantiochytrium limacinum, Strain ATCCMYA-1381" /LENGTH=798 /DNA_ID=CAMNT_0012052935 /DNA_START=166 /DNA_END=2562 /DNA_ORIENTATION=-